MPSVSLPSVTERSPQPSSTQAHVRTSRGRIARSAASWLTLALAWSALLAPALVPASAHAVVNGTYPATPKSWRVYGRVVRMGASLVTNFTDYRYNDKLLSQSSDSVQSFDKIPSDAVIKAAYLFWGGSASGPTGGEIADNTATLTLADGSSSSITADACDLRDVPGAPAAAGKHFYCRRDVTSLLSAHPGNDTWNGTYTVGGINAKVAQITTQCGNLPKPNQTACPGKLETVCCSQNDVFCQARHASWSLVLVYDTKFSVTQQRDVFLWDGFVLLDERRTSLGQISLNIKDFFVGDPPQAELMYYAMEGDKHLGEPAQSSGSCDSTPCGSCYDFISFNGSKLAGGSGNNDVNNIFNSTPETSLDLDRFNVSALIKPKDTAATVVVSSGDGSLANNLPGTSHGYGELVLYGYTVLEVNRLAPNYKNAITKFTVNASEASPGEVLTYTVDMLNNGQLDADPTVLKLDTFPPPGTEYVPGTTLVDGKTRPDVGGTSALATGLNVGNVTDPSGGKSSRKVSFKVKIKDVPGVPAVVSKGLLDYTYKGTVTTYKDSIETNETSVKIIAPTLTVPTLVVAPSKVTPGGSLTWTLTLENASANTIVLDNVVMTSPAEVFFVSTSVPVNATNQSSTTGGDNGTGFLRLEKVPIAANGKVTVTITGKLKDSDALKALGIAQLNGYVVQGQATVTFGSKIYQSDDPTQSGDADPTEFTIQVAAKLDQSSKEGLDLSPTTPLSPGDEMQFSITVVNGGTGDATLSLSDPLPAALEYISSPDKDLVETNNVVTASNVVVKAGQTRTFSFKARVRPSVQAGTSFTNAATLSPTDGSPPQVVQTGTFTVTGGPNLTTSTKTLEDLNGGDLEPGDTVRYTIVITNSGKQPSGTVTVTDPIPSTLTNVAKISGGGTFNSATQTVTWTVPSLLANGGKRVLTFEANIAPAVVNGTKITNVATLTGPELKDPVPVTSEAQVLASPDVSTFSWSVAVQGGGGFVPGATVVYTLKLRNTGKGAVVNGTLTAPFDAELELASASDGGTISGQQVSWALPSLTPGAPELTRTVTAKLKSVVAQGKTFSSQVSFTGTGLSQPLQSDDPNKVGVGDPTVFTVVSAPVITLTKSFTDLNGGIAQGGDAVEFVVAVQNTGNAPATNVVVTDAVHTFLTNVQVTGGSVDASSKTVTWATIPVLNPGDPTVSLRFTATIDTKAPSKTTITNQAGAAFTETPNTASSNTVSFEVENLPDFGASTKAVSAATVKAGDTVTWTLNIVNSGNLSGTQVVVTDVLPPEVTDVVVQGGSFNGSTKTATWTIGSMAPGETQPLVITAKVIAPLADGTQVCNQASVKAKESPNTSLTSPPKASADQLGKPTCFAVSSAAALELTKVVVDVATGQQVNGGLVKPGQALRYEVRVRNTGNGLAQQVVVSDPVSALLTDVVGLDGGTFDASNSTLTWPTVASLGLGDANAKVYRFTAKVKDALDNGLPLPNQAAVTWQGAAAPVLSDDPATSTANDPTSVTVLSNIDLSKATKTVTDDNGGDIKPGDVLTWTISLSNDGDAVARKVQIIDPVDNRLDQVQVQDGGVLANGQITWSLGDLAPGAKASVSFKARVKSPQVDGAQIPNQAQVLAQGFQAPVLTDSNLNTPLREPTVVSVKAKSDLSGSAWSVNDTNGGTVEPGDELVFTLALKNSGDALATNTAVKALLSSTQLSDVKPFDSGTFANDTVDWTVPLIGISPAGDVSLRFSARVKAGLSNGDKITVTGQIPGVTPLPQIVVTVESLPKFDASTLAVANETGWLLKVGQAGPGHQLRLEVSVVNTGKVAASQVAVSLPVGALLSDVQLVTPGTVASGVASWLLPSLAAGGTAKFILRGKVRADLADGAQFTPTATLKPSELATGVPVVGSTVTVLKRPIFKVTKAAEDATGKQLFPGDTLRYSVTVANVGNAAASQLKVTDDLSGVALTDVQPGSGGVLSGKVVTWTIPALAAGQTVTVTLQGKVAAGLSNGAKLVNQAFAKASVGDQAASNKAEITVTYPTLAVTALYLPEAPATQPLKPGDVALLRAVVKADGAFDATNTRVLVPVDTALFELVDTAGGKLDAAAKVVVFDPATSPKLATIAAGGDVVLEIKLRVRATAPNNSEAQSVVTAREGQTKLPYSSAPAKVKIVSVPELSLTKSVKDLNGGKPEPLDVMRYTLTVKVKGKAAAQNVVVTDNLPPELDVVAVGQGGKLEGSKVTWDSAAVPGLKTLAPGDEVVLEIDTRVSASVSDGDTVSNQAFVNADAVLTAEPSDDPATPTPADPTTLKIRVASALGQSTKSVTDDNGAPLLVGDTVTWRVTIVGTSSQPVAGAKVWDPIPSGMTYVPGSTRLNGVVVPDVQGVSPVVTGLLVSSPGQPPGVVAPGASSAAVVTFQTRVNNDVLDGTLLTNTATAAAQGVAATQVGPASIPVGTGPNLRRFQKTAKLLDANGDGVADAGEELLYVLVVDNDGASAASDVTVEDAIPVGATYVASSVALDGKKLTDADDGDAGHFEAKDGGTVRVKLGTLAAGAKREISFRVRITGTQTLSNQAVVRAKGVAEEPSDADGDHSNGNQPTLTPVQGGAPAIQVAKTVQDENGGQVRAGDRLRYAIYVINSGATPVKDAAVVDALPAGLEPALDDILVPAGAKAVFTKGEGGGAGTLNVTGLNVPDGESVVITFRAQVVKNAADGLALCNIARGQVLTRAGDSGRTTVERASKPACVTVGAAGGQGTVQGFVFEDVGAPDDAFQPGKDAVFAGWQVIVSPPKGAEGASVSAITEKDGSYRIAQVPAGKRRVQVRTPSGAVFLDANFDAPGGGSLRLDLALKPTGRLYNAKTAGLVPGLRVFLYYDASDPIAPNTLVPADKLPEGQQGQRVDATGAYLFAPPKGRAYRLSVSVGGLPWAFHSAKRAPEEGVALLTGTGFVVADALPAPGTLTRYFTRFTLQGGAGKTDDAGGPPVPRHNHLPVDALQDAISIALHLSKARALVGEVVHATVTIENNSTTALAANALTGTGGGVLRGLLPEGLGYVAGSLQLRLRNKGASSDKHVTAASAQGPLLEVRRTLAGTSAPVGLDLPVGARLTVRFQAVVSARAQVGANLTTRAQLFDTGGGELTRAATAKVLVQPDPLLDRGTVIGKVFCDSNANGWQDKGEDGLGAARVYVDTGHFSDTDRHGRYHLMDLPPGNHLFKLDKQTLPPGSTLTTDVKRVLWISRGVGLRLNFGVRCTLETARADKVRVKLAPEVKQPEIPKGEGVVHVRGGAETLTVQIDDRTLPAHAVRAMLLGPTTLRPKTLPVAVTPTVIPLGAPLKIAVATQGKFDQHRLDVREVRRDGRLGSVIFERRFRGPPRPLLVQLLPADLVKPGGRYAVRVKATTRYGAGAWSVWVPFEVPRAGVATQPWRIAPPGARVHVNGNPVALRDDGRFDVWIKRPPSRRLLVGLRATAGEGRDAYVTIGASLSKRAVRAPALSDLDQLQAKLKASAAAAEPAPAPQPAAAEPAPAPSPAAPQPAPKAAPAPAAKPTTKAPATTARPKTPATTARPRAPGPAVAKGRAARAATAGAVVVRAPAAPAAPVTAPTTRRAVAGPAAPAGPTHHVVALDLSRNRGLAVGGVHLLPLERRLAVAAPGGPIPWSRGRLLGQVILRVSGVPGEASSAAVVLLDRRGKARVRTPLSVPLPETFVWDPNAAPYAPLPAGVYGLAVEVMVRGQGGEVGWRSAPSRLEVSGTSAKLIPAGEPDRVVRATLFDKGGQPTPSMQGWIDKTASVLKQRSSRIAVVTVHSVAKDATARTQAAAKAISARLRRAGVAADKLVVLPLGSSIADSDPQGTALGDDRVEVRFRAQRLAATSGQERRSYPVDAGYWVDGKAVRGDSKGKAPASVSVRHGKPTLVVAQSDNGTAALWRRVFTPPPGAPAGQAAPQRADSRLAGFGSDLIAELATELDHPETKTTAKAAGSAATGRARASKPGSGAGAKGQGAKDKVRTKDLALAEAGDIEAAQLQVTLPPAGKPLTSQRLALRGRTAPGSKLTVNGAAVRVSDDGTFHHLVKLPIGQSKLLIESTDKAGNTAVLERPLEVAKQAFFLMALADTAVAQVGTKLQGMTERTTVQAGQVLLHGRGAVYLKGRVQGKYLGFKNVRFTAHVDTSKNSDIEDFRSNLFDPERFYPVYGDGTTDTQDVQARGMLYVLVEADRSKVVLGNFRTGVHGFELLRYDRAMYGGYLELNRVFGADFDTSVKVFASQEDSQLSRRTDFMRGTGGSLYYLSNRDVLDGSEKVWLVIRDRDNNTELARIPQQRNMDYNVDYREGRVVFKAPVNSAVDSFFAVGQAGQPGQHLAWNGHPVFVQVTYEARSPGATSGANFGAQVQEKLLKGRVTVGATYVQESRSKTGTAAYRIAGGHAEVKLGKHSKVRAEYAYSESRDSLVSVSDDGGLTFAKGVGTSGGHLDSPVSGHALGLTLDADLRDVGGLFGFTPKRTKGAKSRSFGHVRAYYKLVQAGFHSNGVLTEQGQQKVGVDSRLALSAANTLSLRYDGVLTGARRDPFQTAAQRAGLSNAWGTGSLGTSGSFTPLARQMVTAQDAHRLGRFTLLGAGHYMAGTDAAGTTRHSVTFGGGTSFRVNGRLTLRGEQQLILGGDPNQYRKRVLDHLTTVLGADWKITDGIHFTVSERLGWGGQNATMAGLRTKLSDSSSLYLQQRLEDTYQTGRPMSATVIGAESRYGKDKLSRAYGEYQVDALNAGRMNRAIMGVGKRFVLSKGLNLDAGYERSQTFSGPSGGLSRDTFSVGLEWLRADLIKLTSRQEVRVDEGDKASGGQRKVQVVSLNALSLKPSRDLEFFARGNYLRTENQTLERTDAETLQATTGAAWRPVRHSWLSVIGKYTHLIENRPAGVDGPQSLQGGVSERGVKHIVSFEPVVETPWNLQIAHKFVFRRASERMADSPLAQSDTWLVVSRLGYHLGSTVDLAAEYRWLHTSLAQQSEHGALLEAAYIVAKALRVGAGYNFTRFVQSTAGDIVRDQGGFFLRVIGMY